MGKGPHQRLARLDRRGHPHWGHQVDRRLPRRRPRAGYAQSGGTGDHQRSRHALPGGDHGRRASERHPHRGQHGGGGPAPRQGGYPDDRHRRRRVPGTDAAHGAARGPPADEGNPHLRCESRAGRELRPAYGKTHGQEGCRLRHGRRNRQGRGHRRDRHGKHRAPAAAAPSGAGDALHPRGRQRMRVRGHFSGGQAVCRRLGTDQAPRRVEPRAHVFRREAQG